MRHVISHHYFLTPIFVFPSFSGVTRFSLNANLSASRPLNFSLIRVYSSLNVFSSLNVSSTSFPAIDDGSLSLSFDADFRLLTSGAFIDSSGVGGVKLAAANAASKPTALHALQDAAGFRC